MPIAVVIRRVILITLLVLPQRYWLGHGWRLALRQTAWRRAALRVFLFVAPIAMALVLTNRMFWRFLPAQVGHWLTQPVALWIFSSTFAFYGMQVVHVAAWLWARRAKVYRTARWTEPADPGRRSLVRQVASFVAAVPFLGAFYGYAFERLRFEVVRIDVSLANLPPVLDGLRIVQLSDIHIGDFLRPHEVRRAVELANGLGAHLAVITGDFLTSAGDPLAECIAELGRLRAPLGVWGCNGNHEIYAGAEDEAESLFRRHGMQLLRQSATQLHWNGGSFNLIGIDYQHDIQLTGAVRPSLNGAESLLRRDMPNILLSHNPNVFYSAAALGVELSLAGHTHGGQVNIEIVNHSWSTARFMSRFVAGLYELPLAQKGAPSDGSISRPAYLYVNRGIGTLGVPARVGAAPEITLLTLRSPLQG